MSGHYMSYLVDRKRMMKIDDERITYLNKSAVLKGISFQQSTHILCYTKNTKSIPNPEFSLDQKEVNLLNDITLKKEKRRSEFVSKESIQRYLFGKLNDEIVN